MALGGHSTQAYRGRGLIRRDLKPEFPTRLGLMGSTKLLFNPVEQAWHLVLLTFIVAIKNVGSDA